MFFSITFFGFFIDTALSQLYNIEYPISDFEQKVKTGYFTVDHWYLGGVPKSVISNQHYTCHEILDNSCIEWSVIRDKQDDLVCNCTDESCYSWECNRIYTDIRQSVCKCVNDYCSSWGCESYEEEVVKRGKHSTETELIVSTSQFHYIDTSEWIGTTVSSTRYSQEVCHIDTNVMLWECSRKTYRNCKGNYIWCNLKACIGFLFVYLVLQISTIVSLYYKNFFYICISIFGTIPTIYAIVISGGYTGILSMGVISSVALVSSIYMFWVG